MSSTQVRLGEHHFEMTEGYEQDIDIAAVYRHASYALAAPHDRDIAVIKLASPAKSNSRVGPVCLQSSNADFPPGTYDVQSQSPSIIICCHSDERKGDRWNLARCNIIAQMKYSREKLLSSF